MIIEIPGCKFRIKGEDCDWQVQYQKKRNGKPTWEGKYFFPSLGFALKKAYDLALRENSQTIELKELSSEYEKVADKLLKAVQKAVGK